MPDEVIHFPGYDVERELGRGGMGIVYRAFDRRRGQTVALKTLLHADPEALDRFKREFRALADLALPHVVALHELVSDGARWFFSMEYVEGVSFLEWVRPGGRLDEGRLRDALRQLAEGLAALHEAGMLHRDVKPSNVLVTKRGRVVILDFGLVAALTDAGVHDSTQALLFGTVEYMAPEQAMGGEVSAASDWYCVGAMLYEALAGKPPFTGPPLQVLMQKQAGEPPTLANVDPAPPEDLARLTEELLRADPAARPKGREVVARLAGGAAAPAVAAEPIASRTSLLGRERESAALLDSLRAIRGGRPVVQHVHGLSGMGKSALVEAFLEGLKERDEAIVLAGRCYARESVPYKALDSAVDALTNHLGRLGAAEVASVLPRDVGGRARLSPTLRRVEAVAQAPARGAEVPDPQEVRRRAFGALREMLARIADRRPLVLHVDDAQWGDADSAALLGDLLRPPDPPAVLLLLSYRSEDREESPFLRGVRGLAAGAAGSAETRDLSVEPLLPEDARRLARSLLEEGGGEADAIAAESRGNPFFVRELVRHVREGGGVGGGGSVTLESVLLARAKGLPDEARRLLEVVSVAGVPVPEEEACRAAQSASTCWQATGALRAGHWIRTFGDERSPRLDTYHDRIRETVVQHLAPEDLRAHHLRLAETLEASGTADPELLATHFQHAGEGDRAGRWFAKAATRASEALAFDRAARLWRLAIDLAPADAPERRAMLRNLADALTNARRGAEAAPAYLAASEGLPEADALELRCRAANQLLVSGRLDEWSKIAAPLLEAMGLGKPRSGGRLLASLLLRRLGVRLRGYGFRERSEKDVPPRELVRLDLAYATSVPLAYVDPVWAMELSARQTRLALRAGEPTRVARVLAGEAASSSAAGSRTTERTWRTWRQARALAERIGDAYALATTSLFGGWATYCEGRWPEALAFVDEAEATLRERCTGVAWELNTATFFRLRTLESLGRLDDVARLLPAALDEAEGRNDLYAVTNLRTRIAYLPRLAAGDAEGALREIDRGIGTWPAEPFRIQHVYETQARADVLQYLGRPEETWTLLEERWPRAKRAHVLRVQIVRAWLVMQRARSAVAIAAKDPARRDAMLRAAEQDVGRLVREGAAWCLAYVPLLRAAAAAVRGEGEAAVRGFAEAEEAFGKVSMPLLAAAARRRRGLLRGGAEGARLVEEADAAFRAVGVRDPARWTAMATGSGPD